MGKYIYSTYTYIILCPSYDCVTDWLKESHPACYICGVSMVTHFSQPEFTWSQQNFLCEWCHNRVSMEFINKQFKKSHIPAAVQIFLHYRACLIFILSIRRGKTCALVKLCGGMPRFLASAKKERWLCTVNRTGSSAKGLTEKFDIREHFENLSRKFKFQWNPIRITGTSHEDL